VTQAEIQEMLESLGIQGNNAGASTGAWIETTGAELASVNPTTGEPIAGVRQATVDDYEKVVAASEEAFHSWRMVPAPQRGEVVRQLGDELRRVKDPLGLRSRR